MILLIAPILSFVLGGTGAAADPVATTQAELRATVEALLRNLDGQTLAERTGAERELLDLGPEVLKYFPAPELTPSIAVRESVKRIRIQLERRAARDSAQASLFTCSGNLTVEKLLKELSSQTRNRVEFANDMTSLSSQTLRVDYDRLPFWDCVDDICQRLKLTSRFDIGKGTLTLRPPGAADKPELAVQRVGPYRLSVSAVEIRPIIGDESQRLVRVAASVELEPRLRPLFLHFAAADLTAIAGKGKRLQKWNQAATYELPAGDAGREIPVQFDFVASREDDLSSISIRGKLSVQLAAATERVVFDKTAQTAGTARRRGGVTVRLREVQFESLADSQIQAEIKVTVSYDTGGPAFESHRTWMFHNAVYLETENGIRIDFTEYDTALQSNGAVGVDYRWNQIPGPATRYHFVYEAPTLILDLPLDVSLDAIPVPKSAGSGTRCE